MNDNVAIHGAAMRRAQLGRLMALLTDCLRWGLACLVAIALGAAFVLLFGVLAPLWVMNAVYGSQAVYDSPAHGGVITILTVPASVLIALVGIPLLASAFASRFKASRLNKSLERSRD